VGAVQQAVEDGGGQHLVEAKVLDRKAELDGPDAKPDEEVALAHAGRTPDQARLGAAAPRARGHGLDP
jgi:hypothetical protein